MGTKKIAKLNGTQTFIANKHFVSGTTRMFLLIRFICTCRQLCCCCCSSRRRQCGLMQYFGLHYYYLCYCVVGVTKRITIHLCFITFLAIVKSLFIFEQGNQILVYCKSNIFLFSLQGFIKNLRNYCGIVNTIQAHSL